MIIPNQPTERRNVAETIAEIKDQLVVATRGIAAPVNAMQTATGVKDPIAQHWIELLIAKSRVLREERITNLVTQDARLKVASLKGPARQEVQDDIERGIEEELLKWLTQQPPHRYEKIPVDSGECIIDEHDINDAIAYISLIRLATSDTSRRSLQ